MDGCLCVWMGSPGDDLWLTPAPHLPSGLGQSLMLIKGWLLENRLNGGRVQVGDVESGGSPFVGPMMFVVCDGLIVVVCINVSRGLLAGIVRVIHPLGCTRGRGRRSRGRL